MNAQRAEREKLNICLPLIIRWYREAGRPLPWRQEPESYHVWISEIMLQQTRIEAVIPYYERFLRAFPDVESLSRAEDDRLMKLWEGLGYYSRARNLKKAAVQVMERYGGSLPRQAEELKKLPGIGDYTAGAIASIAYGQPEPAVDGNVLRVMTRLLACPENILSPKTRARLTELLRQSYPGGEEASLLTQGIMELGETICIPNGEARCDRCPVREHCTAHQTDTVGRFPVKSPPRERRTEERTVLLLRHQGRYAIRRRPERGLLAGLWEFPNTEGRLSEEEALAFVHALGLKPLSCAPCGETKHVFTHVEWRMGAYLVDCAGEGGGFLWKSPGQLQSGYPVPTTFRFYQKRIAALEER